jgi:hypothetical protein
MLSSPVLERITDVRIQVMGDRYSRKRLQVISVPTLLIARDLKDGSCRKSMFRSSKEFNYDGTVYLRTTDLLCPHFSKSTWKGVSEEQI